MHFALPHACQLSRGSFDEAHNPLWQLPISGDAASRLIGLWDALDDAAEDVRPVFDFTDRQRDTRFLGDLYQDLSEDAKKRFALLQTPIFVESFILDRTLTPALAEYGLPAVKVIDPTCGSGHFLIGAFERLFAAWQDREPGVPMPELAQRALRAVHGVDLNPFAVAIARFRLIVASLNACGIKRLADAPGWELRLACGDSLLHGPRERSALGARHSDRDSRTGAPLPHRGRWPRRGDPDAWLPRGGRQPAVHRRKDKALQRCLSRAILDLQGQVLAVRSRSWSGSSNLRVYPTAAATSDRSRPTRS